MRILFLLNTIGINVWRRAFLLKTIIEKKHKEIFIRLINKGSMRSRSEGFLGFFKFLIKNRGDMFHVFEPFPPTFPALYLLLMTSRNSIIYDTGDIHFAVSRISNQSFARYLALKSFETMAFRLADKIVMRSRGMREILEHFFKLNPRELLWIPDGVDLIRFSPTNSSRIKEELDLEDKIVIGYASDYRPAKVGGLQLSRGWELIYVSKRLVNMGYKDFAVLMVGRGKALHLLKKMAVDLGVKNYIKFTGFAPEELYPDYINATDICFYESLNDISYQAMTGTKVKEYMACGKPVIAGRIGEAKYVLKNAGILFTPLRLGKRDAPRYISEITSAIMLLMEDESLRRRLGLNARKRAEEYYDWTKIAEKLYSFYHSFGG